jgi:transcriptional regulator with XRE-family HTH domain
MKRLEPRHEPRKATQEDLKLGERIRARRLMAGLSQEALGEKLGVTFQQVQKYERGTNRITFVRLQQIADALDEGLQYFTVSKKPMSKSAETLQGALTHPHAIRLLKAFNKIEDNQRSLLLVQLAETLTEG